jgi:hypothetical protein
MQRKYLYLNKIVFIHRPKTNTNKYYQINLKCETY